MNALAQFWFKHGQKTIASFLGALAVVDLTPYCEDIQAVIGGKHVHAWLRLAGAAGIFWRAMQA
jgi:hypothetical protein